MKSNKYNADLNNRKNNIKAAIAGIAAGFVNGLLGAGGGLILIFAFSLISLKNKEITMKDNFASALASLIPISAFSAINYFMNTSVNLTLSSKLIVPAIIGGTLGAVITDKIRTNVLRIVFAFVIMISGLNMLLK